MKAKRLLLLVMAICLASGVEAQFYDSADDIYYYVECNDNGQALENGDVVIFNFDGNKACDLSGFLQLLWENEELNIMRHGCEVDDVKTRMRKNMMYYEDMVENEEYKLRHVSGNKYRGTTNTLSWTGPMGNNCWQRETHIFDFSYDRESMTDNIERTSHMGTISAAKKFVKVDKSFFKVGRSRTPSGTMHE